MFDNCNQKKTLRKRILLRDFIEPFKLFKEFKVIKFIIKITNMMTKMEFDCKLAHCKEIKKISGFNSIKELYERISILFNVPTNEILFCTLNTHDFKDMNSLLGNYLSIGDLIVVHLCGKSKHLNIIKNQEYLGLTITDNGAGRAFIKKISSNSDLSKEEINLGDHIAAINAESTVGLRHYEVAKAIREVPRNANFTMHLITPLDSDNYNTQSMNTIRNKFNHCNDLPTNDISLLDSSGSTMTMNKSLLKDSSDRPIQLLSNLETISDSLFEDLTNSSLPIDRLLSKGSTSETSNQLSTTSDNNVNNDNKTGNDVYRFTIERINSILESFLGINDNALAIQLYRVAKENKHSFEAFTNAIKVSELSYFNFSEDILTYLWECVVNQQSKKIETDIREFQINKIKL